MSKVDPQDLWYLSTDDWFIYAYDRSDGSLYFVSTEFWDAWLDLPQDADQEENAIERYMLPIAEADWDRLVWESTRQDLWALAKEAKESLEWAQQSKEPKRIREAIAFLSKIEDAIEEVS